MLNLHEYAPKLSSYLILTPNIMVILFHNKILLHFNSILSILGKLCEAYDRIEDIIVNEMRDTDFKISQDRVNYQLSISQSVIVKVAQNEDEDSVKVYMGKNHL